MTSPEGMVERSRGGEPCPCCGQPRIAQTQRTYRGSYQADFKAQMGAARIAASLTERQRNLIATMDGEHRVGDFGWV